jgi:hypothetical protein
MSVLKHDFRFHALVFLSAQTFFRNESFYPQFEDLKPLKLPDHPDIPRDARTSSQRKNTENDYCWFAPRPGCQSKTIPCHQTPLPESDAIRDKLSRFVHIHEGLSEERKEYKLMNVMNNLQMQTVQFVKG